MCSVKVFEIFAGYSSLLCRKREGTSSVHHSSGRRNMHSAVCTQHDNEMFVPLRIITAFFRPKCFWLRNNNMSRVTRLMRATISSDSEVSHFRSKFFFRAVKLSIRGATSATWALRVAWPSWVPQLMLWIRLFAWDHSSLPEGVDEDMFTIDNPGAIKQKKKKEHCIGWSLTDIQVLFKGEHRPASKQLHCAFTQRYTSV